MARNGGGNTTTLRILMGLLPRSKRHMQILGTDPITDLFRLRPAGGYVPEPTYNHEWMKVRRSAEVQGVSEISRWIGSNDNRVRS